MNDQEMIEDTALRRMLWLRHGCSTAALYGDDGEMSCNECRVDFKRMNPLLIEKLLQQASNKKFEAMLANTGGVRAAG